MVPCGTLQVSKPQKKLSNHMTKYHSQLSRKARKQLLRQAMVAKPSFIRQELAQKKLEFKEGWMADTDTKKKDCGNSRSMERFPSDHQELVEFKSHLMGIGGKRRKPSSADAIATEISKMLYFGGPDKLDWIHLTDLGKVKLYMEKMEKMKIGPEGQLTKMERLCDALDYLKYHYQDGRLAEKVAKIEFHIPEWKKVLRVAKQELNTTRLEKLSEEDLDMSIITDVVDNPQMWNTFYSVIERIEQGEDVSDEELKVAMGSVLITLVLKNYQRPGAVCNCTVQEYLASRTVNEDACVIKVANHKTSKYGIAKLVAEMKKKVDDYYSLIRPKLAEPGRDTVHYTRFSTSRKNWELEQVTPREVKNKNSNMHPGKENWSHICGTQFG